MKSLTAYIGSQFAHPRGLIGKCCTLIMNGINQAMYKGVIKAAQLAPNDKVLDIGYGNGYLVDKLYQKYNCYVSGIDPQADMKHLAIKRNEQAIKLGKVQLGIGDCCALVFQNQTFDVVTSVNTIYFWDDPLKGLKEIYRVLQPNGIFYNAVYTEQWLKSLAYTKNNFRLFSKEALITLGYQAGFKEVMVKDIIPNKNYLVIYKKAC